jgi:hypothetical protein
MSPEQAPAVIHQAIAAAYAGRGVAHLTLPQDVISARTDGGVASVDTLQPLPEIAANAEDHEMWPTLNTRRRQDPLWGWPACLSWFRSGTPPPAAFRASLPGTGRYPAPAASAEPAGADPVAQAMSLPPQQRAAMMQNPQMRAQLIARLRNAMVRAHGHHRSAQARQTMPPDRRHVMTPADAPRCLRPTACRHQATGALCCLTDRQRCAHSPVPAAAQRPPGVHPIIAARATQLRVAVRSKPRFTIAGAIRSP